MASVIKGIDYLKALNENKMKIMENCDGLLGDAIDYLGSTDALGEWSRDSNFAHNLFLHTQAYHNFIRKSSLILLGRTGTGKTAILQCLYNDVNNKKNDNYSKALFFYFGDLLNKIAYIKDINDIDYNSCNDLTKLFTVYINILVMKDICKDESVNVKDKAEIKKYLKNSETDSKSLLDLFNESFEGFKNDMASDVTLALKDIVNIVHNKLNNGTYKKAEEELHRILNEENYNYLILIDNADNYPMKQTAVYSAIKAIIATAFNFYNNDSNQHIYIKIAIPSEIYTNIFYSLPGKRQGNTVVIHWKNNELKRMISLRLIQLYEFCKKGYSDYGFELPSNLDLFDCFKNYSEKMLFYENNPDSIQNSNNLLLLFLPRKAPTSLSYYMDTFGYIIHHTLKKPREVMQLFNQIIRIIDEENSISYFIDNPTAIQKVVHGSQEALISSALSMYTDTFEDINDVCGEILSSMDFCFKEQSLNGKIKGAVAQKSYDEKDVKRILLESGLVGEVTNVSQNENLIFFVRAIFEYQNKGKLSFKKNVAYVLHPMCYEHFSCRVHEDSLVLPSATDFTDEIINSVIKK